ncbi:MAG: NADH-quinone oxidoreductase subunit C [Pseudomonadota bacterium]
MKNQYISDYRDYLKKTLPHECEISYKANERILVLTVEPQCLTDILLFLRDDSRSLFKMLTDLTAVDYIDSEYRFEIVYNLLCFEFSKRLRIKVKCHDNQVIPSAALIYKSSSWYEREIWDMYGIAFSGNDDMRRILTDYNFEGHPLRKDFPLTGYVEVRYDNEKQAVIYEPVELVQEFRNFDFQSPWEGTEYIMNNLNNEKANK